MEKEIPPDPGTEEAIALGCTCPVMDNEYGRGYMGMEGVFVFNGACPVHGDMLRSAATDEEE